MEKIIKIEEILDDDKLLPLGESSPFGILGGQDGFKITTNKQSIYLIIDNMQCCCENWGYFFTEDDLDKFIESELLDIKITDSLNNSVDLSKHVDEYMLDENGQLDIYEGGVMFVDIVTSNGVLQFVAYNEHNGYYGHEAYIISEQLNHSEYL